MEDAAAEHLEDSVDFNYDFETRSHTDALGRVLAAISHDGSTISYAYNKSGLLEAVEVTHGHDLPGGAKPVVADIDYNERGQRLKIVYGDGDSNSARQGTTTDYSYEATTFRLTGIHSYVNTPANVANARASDSIRGKSLGEVADGLRAGKISPDELPIEFFVHNEQRVAVNNRGLSALRMAGKEPTRLIEITPTKKTLNRLREAPIDGHHPIPGNRMAVTQNKDGVGDFC